MENEIRAPGIGVANDKMTALVKSSCSRYYTCNVSVNDEYVSMEISSPLPSVDGKSEEIIKQLNDSGDLTYQLHIDGEILYVSKKFKKMSDTSKESIVEIISNMMANLDTALMILTN